ncbi:MAG: OmpP1/FadL family transporter [Syntrophobacteraceae bacterium]
MRGAVNIFGLALGLAAVLLGANLGFGSGFALFEGSARGNALAGAMVGRADDPSALFYNPAGITQLPGLEIMGGSTFITSKMEVRTNAGASEKTTETKNNLNFPPHFYTTYQFSDRVWLGLAIFCPFGLSTTFPENWLGRFNSYNSECLSVTVNPNIAIKLTDRLSVAAGFDGMWFDVTLESKAPLGAMELDQSAAGDSIGYGFNLAVHYKMLDWISLGASYRSEVTQDIDARFDFTPTVPPNLFRDTDASGTLNLPDMLFLGIAFYPTKKLSWEVGAVWTRWSKFHDLEFSFEIPPVPGVYKSRTIKDWRDTWRFVTGIEYKATDLLDLRAGYIFDQEAIRDRYVDYVVPLNNRHFFSFGPGFHFGKWNVDFSYTYILAEDRDVAARPGDGILDSKFKSANAQLLGASVGYKF